MARQTILLSLLALLATAAFPQTVWRCGSSYSMKPCAGGLAVDVTDRSTPEAAARAGKVAAQDLQRAEAMEKARLAAEKNAPKALVIGPKEAPAAGEPAKAPKGRKKDAGKRPEMFTATAPAAKKK